MNNREANQAAAQAFWELLQTVHRGELVVELTDNIRQAVEAVRNRKKPASVTLKLNIALANAGEDDVLHLSMQTSVKMPAVQRGVTTYFVDEQNGISRQRQNQASLFDDGPRLVRGTVIRQGETEREAELADADFADDRRITS